MPEYFGEVDATVALMTDIYDFQILPTIFWHTFAIDNIVSHKDAVGGSEGAGKARANKATGDIEGQAIIIPQDTYISGTAGRTGRAFTVVQGTAKDDVKSIITDKYKILFPDSTFGATHELLDVNAVTRIMHTRVIIGKGPPPPGGASTAANTYFILELSENDSPNYRIIGEYGQPFRIEYRGPQTGGLWYPYIVCSDVPDTETYFEAHNRELVINIKPDISRGTVCFQIGNHPVWYKHGPERPIVIDNPNAVPVILGREKYRFIAKNGWASLETYPLRHSNPTIKAGKKQFAPGHTGIANAQVVPNLLGDQSDNQTFSKSVTQDADGFIQFDVNMQRPDAGEGYGSLDPPRFSDALLIVPGLYSIASFTNNIPDPYLRVVAYKGMQVWDDVMRLGYTNGKLWVNNKDGYYYGMGGSNYAVNIITTNGHVTHQQMRGIMGHGPEGIHFSERGSELLVQANVSDRHWVVQDCQLDYELVLDGFHLFSAVHELLKAGNISPLWLQFIPHYGYPPYNLTGIHPILGKGTGTNPKYRFLPGTSPLSAILELIQDEGIIDFTTGASIPYMLSFDVNGFPHLEAYNPKTLFPKAHFSTVPTWDFAQAIHGELSVYTSVEDIRTAVTVQGLDAFTNELLQDQRELWWNYSIVGYRKAVLERGARYASQAFVKKIGDILSYVASLPSEIYRFMTIHNPHIFAGDVINITDYFILNGTVTANILQKEVIVAHNQNGVMDCYDIITARNIWSS